MSYYDDRDFQSQHGRDLDNKEYRKLLNNRNIFDVYTDGGVIKKNPSTIGGTWAYRFVEGFPFHSNAGTLTKTEVLGDKVTNNQTEMIAVILALLDVPHDFAGTVYSDSMITIGRMSMGYKWKNIPQWMQDLHAQNKERLVNWDKIQWVNLKGHPTKKALSTGIDESGGRPVSIHNVWCDKECGRMADLVLENDDYLYSNQASLHILRRVK